VSSLFPVRIPAADAPPAQCRRGIANRTSTSCRRLDGGAGRGRSEACRADSAESDYLGGGSRRTLCARVPRSGRERHLATSEATRWRCHETYLPALRRACVPACRHLRRVACRRGSPPDRCEYLPRSRRSPSGDLCIRLEFDLARRSDSERPSYLTTQDHRSAHRPAKKTQALRWPRTGGHSIR
jgi:hypothetical protein